MWYVKTPLPPSFFPQTTFIFTWPNTPRVGVPHLLPIAYPHISVTFGAFPELLGAMIPVEPTMEHPVPFDLSDELPKTHADAVAVAVNTVDLISQLGGSIDFDNEDLHKAKSLITGEGKGKTPKHVISSAEASAAHNLIRRFDFSAFADALQARNFITNKLITLADCGDPKLEIKALELLGKHSDIGLFTNKSEITINYKNPEELENAIKERVKRLLNADIIDVTPLGRDLDEELGVAQLEYGELDEMEDAQFEELTQDEDE